MKQQYWIVLLIFSSLNVLAMEKNKPDQPPLEILTKANIETQLQRVKHYYEEHIKLPHHKPNECATCSFFKPYIEKQIEVIAAHSPSDGTIFAFLLWGAKIGWLQ